VHPVPLLPPSLAAALTTSVKLVCPVLLVLGLLTRLAALPMLGMAMVIQFVVGANDPSFWQTEHYYWMFLLAFIILKEPGPISLDRQWLTRRYGVPT
jgi:putative oxidoreductase